MTNGTFNGTKAPTMQRFMILILLFDYILQMAGSWNDKQPMGILLVARDRTKVAELNGDKRSISRAAEDSP